MGLLLESYPKQMTNLVYLELMNKILSYIDSEEDMAIYLTHISSINHNKIIIMIYDNSCNAL